jgi:hypothetical protein
MKNIHILPTDQPSRLCIDNSCNELNYSEKEGLNSKHVTNQCMYITSDEEIKEGDYCVDGNDIYGPYEDGDIATDKFIKIILTTDSQLIRYGVQVIDDEFLKWFVKNPTCEFVEVNYELGNCLNCEWNHDMCPNAEECLKNKYMIIIPQEEPKQDQDPCNLCGKTLREQMKGCYEITCYRQFLNKQETLKEVAERLAPNSSWRLGFIAGANYMAERMYSEEEIMEMFHKFSMYLPFHYEFLVKEQFKKK